MNAPGPLRLLLLAALLFLGAWPFLELLGYWPMAPDSGLWISRGATFQPDWQEWVFHTRHFGVGYRPLTALSYTANQALGGLDPFFFRATDLSLHLIGAGLLYGLVRALEPATSLRPLLAMAVFLLVPCTDDVVPYIARRGYSLATALSLGGLLFATRGRSTSARIQYLRSLVVGLLIGLAVLAHEAALLSLVLLLWIHGRGTDSVAGAARRVFAGSLVPTLCVAGALALRLPVVEGIGGYAVEDEERGVRALSIFIASLRALFFREGLEGGGPLQEGALLFVALPALFWGTVRGTDRLGRATTLLWLGAIAGLYASQGVWFDRQAYFMATPLALFVALGFPSPAEGGRRVLPLVATVLILGILALHSPITRGKDPVRTEHWSTRQAMIDDLAAALRNLEAPAQVSLVLPYVPTKEELELRARKQHKELSRGDRLPAKWAETLMHGTGITIEEFAYVEYDSKLESSTPPAIVMERGELWLAIPTGLRYQSRQRGRLRGSTATDTTRLRLPTGHVFHFTGAGGALVPVP